MNMAFRVIGILFCAACSFAVLALILAMAFTDIKNKAWGIYRELKTLHEMRLIHYWLDRCKKEGTKCMQAVYEKSTKGDQ